MKKLLDKFLGRRVTATSMAFPNLPESIAYSAFLASGVEGTGEVSFAQFVATLPSRHLRHAHSTSIDFAS